VKYWWKLDSGYATCRKEVKWNSLSSSFEFLWLNWKNVIFLFAYTVVPSLSPFHQSLRSTNPSVTPILSPLFLQRKESIESHASPTHNGVLLWCGARLLILIFLSSLLKRIIMDYHHQRKKGIEHHWYGVIESRQIESDEKEISLYRKEEYSAVSQVDGWLVGSSSPSSFSLFPFLFLVSSEWCLSLFSVFLSDRHKWKSGLPSKLVELV